MAKFVISCPDCNNSWEVHTWFDKAANALKGGTNRCSCGRGYEGKSDQLASRSCGNCGNAVVYDQRKGESAQCPICAEKIYKKEDEFKFVSFACPQCQCTLSTQKGNTRYTCPVCELSGIDVAKEAALAEIKKTGLASVIKYEGDNDTFVWKHPVEDFNIGSQLIVHESQEAIFFRDGQARETFPAGRYTLDTQSIPVVHQLWDKMVEPSGIFHAEVYFVNLTTQMGIKWGTDSRVRFLEPVSGIPLDIGANGRFNMRVNHARKLLLKLVGTESGLDRSVLLSSSQQTSVSAVQTDDASIVAMKQKPTMQGYFRAMIMTRVKTHLAKTIKENQINILEIDEHLGALSDALREILNVELEEYGLTLPEFYVEFVDTPDQDQNFKDLKAYQSQQYLKVRAEQVRKAEAEAAAERMAVEARRDAQMRIIDAQGKAEATKIAAGGTAEAYRLQAEAEALEMQMKGYTYAQETQRQIGLEAVQGGIIKEGSGTGGGGSLGGGLGDVVGLGVTLGAIGGVIGLTKDALTPALGASADIGRTVGGLVNSTVHSIEGLWDCPCGEKGIVKNFCSDCGAKRPAAPATWDCACGEKGNAKGFCSNCGTQKAATWDCACGNKGIAKKFCDECGQAKGDAQ
jgi:membrane protease subunit (stomatin/prohibitin family)